MAAVRIGRSIGWEIKSLYPERRWGEAGNLAPLSTGNALCAMHAHKVMLLLTCMLHKPVCANEVMHALALGVKTLELPGAGDT